jgi:hypothetical protein
VFRLLDEDLQYETYYWLGNIYNNIGDYELCYKYWKIYAENFDKSFNPRVSKYNRVIKIIKNFENICEK